MYQAYSHRQRHFRFSIHPVSSTFRPTSYSMRRVKIKWRKREKEKEKKKIDEKTRFPRALEILPCVDGRAFPI